VRYCHVAGGGQIRFQIRKSIGGFGATAFTNDSSLAFPNT